MLTLNKHAPLKTRYGRANNSPFMNNDIYKAIMVRSRLRNKYLNLKTEESKNAYSKQRNYCVSLIRKADFYEHLDPKLICDNRKVWKQVKPFFQTRHLQIVILHYWRMIKPLLIHLCAQKFLTIFLLMQFQV